jgi:hypothetical protein
MKTRDEFMDEFKELYSVMSVSIKKLTGAAEHIIDNTDRNLSLYLIESGFSAIDKSFNLLSVAQDRQSGTPNPITFPDQQNIMH